MTELRDPVRSFQISAVFPHLIYGRKRALESVTTLKPDLMLRRGEILAKCHILHGVSLDVRRSGGSSPA